MASHVFDCLLAWFVFMHCLNGERRIDLFEDAVLKLSLYYRFVAESNRVARVRGPPNLLLNSWQRTACFAGRSLLRSDMELQHVGVIHLFVRCQLFQ